MSAHDEIKAPESSRRPSPSLEDDDTMPSIRRAYQASFLRIFAYSVLWTGALVLGFWLLWLVS